MHAIESAPPVAPEAPRAVQQDAMRSADPPVMFGEPLDIRSDAQRQPPLPRTTRRDHRACATSVSACPAHAYYSVSGLHVVERVDAAGRRYEVLTNPLLPKGLDPFAIHTDVTILREEVPGRSVRAIELTQVQQDDQRGQTRIIHYVSRVPSDPRAGIEQADVRQWFTPTVSPFGRAVAAAPVEGFDYAFGVDPGDAVGDDPFSIFGQDPVTKPVAQYGRYSSLPGPHDSLPVRTAKRPIQKAKAKAKQRRVG